MSAKATSFSEAANDSPGKDQIEMVRVIAVGEPGEWTQKGNFLPKENVAFMAFHDVTDTTLEYLSPTIIYSPVLAPSFDCIELAILLHNLGFKGEYRAFARDLPKPDLIVREVRQICPRLSFQIVSET